MLLLRCRLARRDNSNTSGRKRWKPSFSGYSIALLSRRSNQLSQPKLLGILSGRTFRFSEAEELTQRKSKTLDRGLRLHPFVRRLYHFGEDRLQYERQVERRFYLEVEEVSQQIGIPGVVRNGLVVPQSKEPLPEGSHVEILLQPGEIPASLRLEIEAWDNASDESWNWIETLETDEK